MTDSKSLELQREFLQLGAMLVGIVTAGTIGYRVIEGWPLFDALYMTVISLATVGYSETHPLSTSGRVFTLLLIVFGMGLLAYGISQMTSLFVEGELSNYIRRRRMNAKLSQLTGHYIVCGGGGGGEPIIRELKKMGKAFVVIERNAEQAEDLRRDGDIVLEDDATEDEVLERAGIARAAGLFASLADDRDNVFVTVTARGLNPKIKIVAREEGLGRKSKLKSVGADVVVNPAFIGGLRMTSEMIRPTVVGFLDSMIRAKDSKFRFAELTISKDCPFIDKSVQDLYKVEGDAALVVAVKAPGNPDFEINPHQDRKLKVGDTLVVLGDLQHLEDLRKEIAAQ